VIYNKKNEPPGKRLDSTKSKGGNYEDTDWNPVKKMCQVLINFLKKNPLFQQKRGDNNYLSQSF